MLRYQYIKVSYLIIVFTLLLSSCASRKKIVYFQSNKLSKSIKGNDVFLPVSILKPGDLLSIVVASSNLETVRPFNLPSVSYSLENAKTSTNSQLQSYLVSNEGTIEFPVLGTIDLSGLNTKEATKLIETKLKEYVLDPIVLVRLLNFKVTLLGELNRPGTYYVANERITLLEALGLAGDISIWGKRENVLIVREINGVTNKIRVDLTSDNLFDSEAYYLQQNDVIYIEPNKTKINSSSIGVKTSVFISIISSVITLAIVLLR